METAVAHGTRRGMLLIMTASTLWGTVGVSSRIISQLAYTNWLSLAFMRMIIAAPILLIIGQRVLGKQMWSMSRRDLGLMMLIGVLLASSQSLYFAAVPLTGVAVATLVAICVAPVVVTLVTAILNQKRPSNFVLFSIALALIGTTFLVLGGQMSSVQSISLTGVALAFGAACGYAGTILVGRFLANRCHALQVTAVAFSTGAILLAVVGCFVGFVGSYPATGWALLLYIGVVPTALGYQLLMTGMQTTPAPIASVASLLEPLTATFLAWILFNEWLGLVGLVGAAMLLFAIYLLSTKENVPVVEL